MPGAHWGNRPPLQMRMRWLLAIRRPEHQLKRPFWKRQGFGGQWLIKKVGGAQRKRAL